MRAEGLEPSRSFEHRHLKPARIPISPRPRASDPNASSISEPCQSCELRSRMKARKGLIVRQRHEAVQRLIATGLNDCAIARLTGIPRPTVRDWRCRPQIRERNASSSACGIDHDYSALPPAAYSYLLGFISAMAAFRGTAASGG